MEARFLDFLGNDDRDGDIDDGGDGDGDDRGCGGGDGDGCDNNDDNPILCLPPLLVLLISEAGVPAGWIRVHWKVHTV